MIPASVARVEWMNAFTYLLACLVGSVFFLQLWLIWRNLTQKERKRDQILLSVSFTFDNSNQSLSRPTSSWSFALKYLHPIHPFCFEHLHQTRRKKRKKFRTQPVTDMSGETVKVMVRCRPMNKLEISKNCGWCVQVDTKSHSIQLKNDKDADESKVFSYDYVFPPDILQQTVYENSAFPLVESVVEGYNGTIFAYGQTGTPFPLISNFFSISLLQIHTAQHSPVDDVFQSFPRLIF